MTIKYLDSKRISALSSDALVAHLKFNDNVTDSANSNNGTVTGTTTYVAGKIDKADQPPFCFSGSCQRHGSNTIPRWCCAAVLSLPDTKTTCPVARQCT